MFDQHKLALGMEISEEDLDKTSGTIAHELVHAMGVGHDGAEGNQDCAGQYHSVPIRSGPKYVPNRKIP